MTVAKSAYPAPVENLLPQARELADRLGAVPSRNRVMSEFRIGARKANTILAHLAAEPDQADEPPETTGPRLAHEPGPDSPGPGHSDSAENPTEPIPAVSSTTNEQSGTGVERVETTGAEPLRTGSDTASAPTTSELTTGNADPDTPSLPVAGGRMSSWPLCVLALPAFVAIWSGWVGLGAKTGFGLVHPLPGIADGLAVNTAITLPIGVEAYAAYALRVWLSGRVPARARRFARVSALGSLALGALGQIAFHLMDAAGIRVAPWPITTLVSCLPVVVLGMGAALTHLIRDTHHASEVDR